MIKNHFVNFLLFASLGGYLATNASDVVTDNTYVQVTYATTPQSVVYFDFNECYPYRINGANALHAIWLQSTTCFNYQYANCTGTIFPPLGVPVPGGTILANVADFVHIIGQSALCKQNKALPSIEPLTAVGL